MNDWKQFLLKQEQEFGKETVDRWLRSLVVKNFDACNLYLEAKDSFQALWFEEHIRHKLGQFVNCNQRPIFIHLGIRGQQQKTKTKRRPEAPQNSFPILFEELDSFSSFESFICTEDNEIAFKVLDQACTTLVASKVQAMSTFSQSTTLPPTSFNPIYIYGPPGSGKSHLLTACAHKLRRVGYNAIYASCDLFTDHVVRSIRAGEMSHFRSTYRMADILIVDDIQNLGRKNATQEEFFHTFNAFHTAGKQIILAANGAPAALAHIEARLISRFEWGIALPIAPLQKKELIKMIENKASALQFPLASRTAEFLSESFSTNPKSTARALDALILRSHLAHKQKSSKKTILPLAAVKTMLADLIEKEKSLSLSHERIIAAVAEHYGMPIDDLTGKSQSRECVVPRQLAMYLCRLLLQLPYMKIGDIFSRDHSTVMAAVRQIQKQLTLVESDVAAACNTIQAQLQSSSVSTFV